MISQSEKHQMPDVIDHEWYSQAYSNFTDTHLGRVSQGGEIICF